MVEAVPPQGAKTISEDKADQQSGSCRLSNKRLRVGVGQSGSENRRRWRMLNEATLTKFKESLRGRLIQSNDQTMMMPANSTTA